MSGAAARFGAEAERLSADCLRRAGCAVLARNYRVAGRGEVDLVANRGRALFCVEVKARRVSALAEAEECAAEAAVDVRKIRRLQYCMLDYCRRHAFRGYALYYLGAALYFSPRSGRALLHFFPLDC